MNQQEYTDYVYSQTRILVEKKINGRLNAQQYVKFASKLCDWLDRFKGV
ncbi:hypothetical protein ANABIO4_39250 [Bacillus subtilis]|nr:hypothetical protein ANABIO4_39250 [Bacillus subtilis]